MKTRDPGAPQSDAPLRQKRSNGACRHSGISGAEMDTTRGGRGPTNTETPYPRSLKSYLLEAAGTRPCGRRASEQGDELASPNHSITSSARASSVAGTSMPSALAVVRSMTRSNFVEARRMRVCYPSRPSARMVSCTFGLAPIRAMYALMFGHFARSILWILVQLSTVNR